MTVDVLPTQNPSYGFYGTMQDLADDAWPLAISAIYEATGYPAQDIRRFLDSRGGRYFAKGVKLFFDFGLTLEDSISVEVAEAMREVSDDETCQVFGIPVGTPLLLSWLSFENASLDAGVD